MPEISLTLAFLAGLASFLAPCSLVMIPTLMVFLASSKSKRIRKIDSEGNNSQSLEKNSLNKISKNLETQNQTQNETKTQKKLKNEKPSRFNLSFKILIYSLGFYLAFLILAFSILGPLSLFSEFRREITVLSGVFMVIFGISGLAYKFLPSFHIQELFTHFGDFLTRLFLKLFGISPNSNKVDLADYREMSIFAGFFGFLTAFSWTPCLGPVAGSILSLASSEENLSLSLLAVTFFVLGLKTPLILWGLYLDLVHPKLKKLAIPSKIKSKASDLDQNYEKNTKSDGEKIENSIFSGSPFLNGFTKGFSAIYYYFFNFLFVVLGVMVITGQYAIFIGYLESFLAGLGVRFL